MCLWECECVGVCGVEVIWTVVDILRCLWVCCDVVVWWWFCGVVRLLSCGVLMLWWCGEEVVWWSIGVVVWWCGLAMHL